MSVHADLTAIDRDAAIILLGRRLSPTDLRDVLHAVQVRRGRRKSVEWIVAETEHPGGGRLPSRLPDGDLARFLVDLAGPELLSFGPDRGRELRLRLARSASADELDQLHEHPSQCRGREGRESQVEAIAARPWHAGKGWPAHFVRVLGFPVVFAGLEGIPSEPDSVDVEPFVPLPDLEDFQSDLKQQLLEMLDGGPGRNRGILTLPTGAGKTRTAVEGLVEWRLAHESGPGILWIAQSEELCEQAVQAFREVWIDLGHRSSVRETLTVNRLWGSGRMIPVCPGVVVASIQELHAICRGRNEADGGALERFTEFQLMAEQIGAVVVDEAHRMLAPSYTEVLGILGLDLARGGQSRIPLVGLTATPFRSQLDETRRLANRFHGRLLAPSGLGEDPVSALRAREVLSRPTHQVLQHDGQVISIDDVQKYRAYFDRFSDFHPDLLATLGQQRARNGRVLEALCTLPASWPTLFFGCSVEQATAMSVLLRRRGRSAATVTGETRAATRRFLVEEFRAGRVSVLCNYGVLTTGFDAPRVRALVVARPTASPVLYEQMIGRGMRGPRFGGTEECLVIDVEDNIRFGGQVAFKRYEEYWSDHQDS